MGEARVRSRELAVARSLARSREEYVVKLRDQLRFLNRSAADFDAGDEAESQRIATAIRTLCHDTASSHSLLGQMHLLTPLRFLDTAPGYDQANLVSTPGLAVIEATLGPGEATARYVPALGNSSVRSTRPFAGWWTRQIMRAAPTIDEARPLTRKLLVLMLANKEGGTHIDPNRALDYQILANENGLGWMLIAGGVTTSTPSGNPIAISVRQVGYELETTLREQLPPLLPEFFGEGLSGL